MAYKVAAIGKKESLSIYEALGIDIFDVRNEDDVNRKLREISGYGLVLIDEEFADVVRFERNKKSIPLIDVIPTRGGRELKHLLSNLIIRAVGTKIFSEGNNNGE
ncbi:MAG: V-type ATP synthase subunit F [bacterium]